MPGESDLTLGALLVRAGRCTADQVRAALTVLQGHEDRGEVRGLAAVLVEGGTIPLEVVLEALRQAGTPIWRCPACGLQWNVSRPEAGRVYPCRSCGAELAPPAAVTSARVEGIVVAATAIRTVVPGDAAGTVATAEGVETGAVAPPPGAPARQDAGAAAPPVPAVPAAAPPLPPSEPAVSARVSPPGSLPGLANAAPAPASLPGPAAAQAAAAPAGPAAVPDERTARTRAAVEALEPGRILGGCRVVRLLARGGMGAVYEAVQESLARTVALKILPPRLARNPRFVARFDRESVALATLNHPNIVSIFDRGIEGDYFYFVMEYVTGITLRDRLACDPVSVPEACRIVGESLAALEYAHAKGVVHRDIKPENVLLTEEGRVKIVDFGIAYLEGQNALEADRGTRTGKGSLTIAGIGTAKYIAPEQKKDTRSADHRADLFSLGVVLFEMLTRRLPQEVKESLTALRPDVPPALEAFVARLMSPQPGGRFPDAGAARAELAAITAALEGGPPAAAPAAAAGGPAPGSPKAEPAVGRITEALFLGPVPGAAARSGWPAFAARVSVWLGTPAGLWVCLAALAAAAGLLWGGARVVGGRAGTEGGGVTVVEPGPSAPTPSPTPDGAKAPGPPRPAGSRPTPAPVSPPDTASDPGDVRGTPVGRPEGARPPTPAGAEEAARLEAEARLALVAADGPVADLVAHDRYQAALDALAELRRKYLKSVPGLRKEIEAREQEVVKKARERYETYKAQAENQRAQGNWKEALAALEPVRGLGLADLSAEAERFAGEIRNGACEAARTRAEGLRTEGRLAEAIGAYRAALEYTNDRRSIITLNGEIERTKGEVKEEMKRRVRTLGNYVKNGRYDLTEPLAKAETDPNFGDFRPFLAGLKADLAGFREGKAVPKGQVDQWDDQVDKVAVALGDREGIPAAERCRACAGAGQRPCAACKSTGHTVGRCPTCRGEGTVPCPECRGQARVRCVVCDGRGRVTRKVQNKNVPCPNCKGTGKVLVAPRVSNLCPVCGGTGDETTEEEVRCAKCQGTRRMACPKCTGSPGKNRCSACSGSGEAYHPCAECDGVGAQPCLRCKGSGRAGGR